MKTCLVVLLCCAALVAIPAAAQTSDDGFQMANVVAFEHVAANAQHPENADQYKISMRLNDLIYNCHANAPAATFIDWVAGKQFPAKVNGKTLLLKNPDGQIVEMTILNTKKPK